MTSIHMDWQNRIGRLSVVGCVGGLGGMGFEAYRGLGGWLEA